MLPFPPTTAPAVPSATPFASDLRAARDARGTTLDQIQQQTRIPVDVLKRFEGGLLLQDEAYNDVYLRAFVKSYAKAVGLSPGEAVAAFDLHRAGRYDGRLHPEYDPATAPPPPTPVTPEVPSPTSAAPTTVRDTPPSAPDAPVAAAPVPGRSAAPAVEALRQSAPAAPSMPAAVSNARVARPAVPGARRSFDKNWGTILALFGGFVVVLGGLLWYLVIRDGDAPESDAPRAADGSAVAIDSSGTGAGAAGGGPRLQLPIRVTVAAGGDGLQSFRVTADGGDRRPYWINSGAQQVFSADSSLVLWGEGDALSFAEATLDLQGQRWAPPSGRPVRLDAVRGQALLDSLAGSPPVAPAGAAPAGTAAP